MKALSPPTRPPDPRERRISEGLARLGPGPLAYFVDACRHVREPFQFESTTHIVGHLLRELEGSLLDLLVPVELFGRQGGSDSHKAKVLAVLAFLEIDAQSLVAEAWLNRVKGDDALHKRAHRMALERPRPVDDAFLKLWDTDLWLLDEVLRRLEVRYLHLHRRIDEIVSAPGAPAAGVLRRVKEHVPHNSVSHEYFFRKLAEGGKWEWITPLREAGWFAHPPAAIRNEEERSVTITKWPASSFLARVAGVVEAHPALFEAICNVPEVDNVSVYKDLVVVLSALPTSLSRQLVARVSGWMNLDHVELLADEVAGFACKLATNGELDAALSLAKAVLTVLPDSRAEPPEDKADAYQRRPEARARVAQWNYDRLLDKYLAPLAHLAPRRFLDLLLDLLEDASRLSSRTPAEPENDHTFVSRPAIEDDAQNQHDSIEDSLISASRDLALRLSAADPTEARELVAVLEARTRPIFRRLALHLLVQSDKALLDLVGERCCDPSLFDDMELNHERFNLLRAHFPEIHPSHRERFFDRVEAGPDLERFVARFRDENGRDPVDAELDVRRNRWRLKQLRPIRDVLPKNWKERYDSWVEEFGESDHPEFFAYHTSGVGPISPVEVDELMKKSVDEIVSFLQTWKPPEGFMVPTREGLSRSLTQAVVAAPAVFSRAARAFTGLDPTYVRAVLWGFRDALAKGDELDWASVLALAEWVVAQPRQIDRRSSACLDEDPHWGWTRSAIVRLLEQGFSDQKHPMPLSMRERIWSILAPITSDPDPTPEDDVKCGKDPIHQSYNSTRGTAVSCAISYARWVTLEAQTRTDATPSTGFDGCLEEVRNLLERRLDPLVEPSPAIRSIYGRMFDSLSWLDRGWASSQIVRIFGDIERDTLGETAWNSYLSFNTPNDVTFTMLEPIYRKSCDLLNEVSGRRADSKSDTRTREFLSEHMMHLCWHGKSEITDSHGILAAFFSKASEDLRAHAISYLGRSLHSFKEPGIEEPFASRITRLWETRLALAENEPDGHRAEIAEFGWWFASGKLDEPWAIDQLLRVIACAGCIGNDMFVVQRLSQVAVRDPLAAVKCFEAIAGGQLGPWSVAMWSEDARNILECGLAAGGEAAAIATEVINKLGARGYLDFASLLSR